MKKTIIANFLLLLALSALSQKPATQQLPTKAARKEITLNGLWNFESNTDHKKVKIRVPGCYTNVWDGKWGKPYWDAFGYPRNWAGKGAIYEKEITITDSMLGKNIRLHIDGCWQNFTVMFGNKTFDTIHDGYSARYFDLGKFEKPTKIPLKIRIEDEATRLSGGESMASRGLWDDISLQILPDIFVEHPLVIQTSVAQKSITCSVPLFNTLSSEQSVTIKYYVTDATGKVVKTFNGGEHSLPPNQTTTIENKASWQDPHLWFPHDPYLYHLNTVVYSKAGKVIDWQKERFGFREITWGNAKLYMNGRELWLRGHGEHYLGDIQASREYFTTWFTELKKMGVNFMRLHIYPRHKIMYEVADELGFLLEAEPAFHFKVTGTEEFAKNHLGDMMKNLINHPSIFTWSVSNELRWQGGGEKPWLIDHAHSIDKTRPAFASDFSEFSTHGDIIGHHYNTETVFKEWEQFGPQKPMVWDECGEVWQPTRPLGNGSAGYEVIAQDYATGIYRDGHNEIKAAFDLVREGKEFAGSLHRINAISPWDFGCVFFRWQPYNRFKGIAPKYGTLESPGVKPIQVLPCTTPVNIWDPTLPVYEPNPGYYLFAEDMKWVRFPYDNKNFSFFGGKKAVITSPLMMYDDLRFTDEVHCKIETSDGKLLSQTIQKIALKPGDMLRNVKWAFTMPITTTAQSVNIIREFWYKGKLGYKDVREGHIYPALNVATLKLANQKIGVVDPSGKLSKLLKKAKVPFTTPQQPIAVGSTNILLVQGDNLPENALQLIESGIRIIQFQDSTYKLTKGSARLLANGPAYSVLSGIGQQELTFWNGSNEYGGMDKPNASIYKLNKDKDGTLFYNMNYRTLIAGDKDGKTSALHEIYIGNGCHWVTSLKLIDAAETEPAAAWLIHNLIEKAAAYAPTAKGSKSGLYGAPDFARWFQTTYAQSRVIKDLDENELAHIQVLILDARGYDLTEAQIKAVKTFVFNGGKVLVYKIGDKTLPYYQKLISDSLTLQAPFLDERSGCVKAATSWTLRTSPKTGIEYYDSIVIPQPFEPNYDPMLAGLSNIDLNWNGKPMFEKGVRINGISPVSENEKFKILVSNWRNDWSVPPFGAEYINEGKDMRQALWYLNRTPVLANSKHGKGTFVLCQLDLMEGGEKGLNIARHILTDLNCPVDLYTNFPEKSSVFDFNLAKEQKRRLEVVNNQLATLKPLDSVPSILYNMGGSSDGKQRKILLLSDSRFLQISPDIIKKMKGFGNLSYSGVAVNNPKTFLNNTENALGGTKWDVVYLSIGYDGIKDFSESGLQSFDADMQAIVTTIKNTGAKIMWGTQPPLPKAWFGELDNDKITLLNQRAKKVMDANGVLVNDTYAFMMAKTPEYVDQDKKDLTLINSDFFKAFTPKLVTTIVEALKFFGN